MTDTLKSVLFVDYDSLHLALRARDPALARRLAARPAVLVEAIEAGGLIASAALGGRRRRILMRRCYADPRVIGRARDGFVTQGFQIVDCPTLAGHERNAAEVQIALDTIDALAHPTAFDEFILIGADSDFSPLVYRLRAHNRAVTVFATRATAASSGAIADGVIDEAALVALLAEIAEPETADTAEDEPVRLAPVRDDLATVARRIHNATQVPLFPPRVYAELFRSLTEEIAERGYHFQDTAENVAARLVAAGRKASRRQVAFVVKGLALKGHVLSDRDTPEALAEVFREQVIYLARHAGIDVDPRVERLVAGWIAGTAVAEPAEPIATAVASPEPEVAKETPPDVEAAPVAATLAVEALAMPVPSEVPPPVADAEETADQPEPDEAAAEEAEADEAEALPAEDEATPEDAPAEVALDATEPADDGAEDLAVDEDDAGEEDLAALADQPEPGDEAEADEALPVAPPVVVEPAAARAAPAVRPPVPRLAPPKNGTPPAEAPLDPFESSLLAAIAEAVQAVEPARGKAPPVAPAEAEPRIEPRLDIVAVEPPEPGPQKSAAEAEVEADIGDEIQRILAAYSQSRKPGPG